MAKSKKQIIESTEVNEENVEAKKYEGQMKSDEIIFLESLLDTQESGNWHGPASSIIKERLKELKQK